MGPWSLVGTTGTNQVTYTDSSLTPGTRYFHRVRAYNATGSSAPSNVAIATTKPDLTPPAVSITSPASGTLYTVAQPVTIRASASDNVGVTRVEFYNGATLRGTATASPYTYAWAVTSAKNGTHTWTAKAYDATDSSVSSPVSLTVNIPVGDTIPPRSPARSV